VTLKFAFGFEFSESTHRRCLMIQQASSQRRLSLACCSYAAIRISGLFLYMDISIVNAANPLPNHPVAIQPTQAVFSMLQMCAHNRTAEVTW